MRQDLTADQQAIVDDEEQSLVRNLDLLKRPRPETQIDVYGIQREMEDLREQMRDADHDERPGMLMAFERLGHLLLQAGKSMDENKVDASRPYFGHMRLEENGKQREVFLGKATRLDNGLRIVDWRHAPVSRIFYRHAEGDEYDEDFGDRIVSGEVLARRTVGISNGQLNRVQSPKGGLVVRGAEGWTSFGEEAPQLAGGERSAFWIRHDDPTTSHGQLGSGAVYRVDKHLPEISALIDPEQWSLITADDSQLVVIRGVAGSGKTTVALHRLAYLNYKDGRRYRADRMLVVVWGDALRRFIGRVLPDLGVRGTQVRTYGFWAASNRERLFPMLPKRRNDDTPAAVTRIKLHPAMLPIMESYVSRHEAPSTAMQAIDDWSEILSDSRRLVRGLNKAVPGAFTENEVKRFVSYTSRQIDALGEHLEPDQLDGPSSDEADIVHKQAFLDDEDDTLLLRLWQLRVGPIPQKGRAGRPLKYQHLAIDEVQDLSPLEVRVLMDCVDNRKSITLAGDTQQHVLQEAGFVDWEEFFSHLGVKGTEVSTLQVAYRSTKPIVAFARAVLGPLAEDDDVEVPRDGVPVEVLPFGDHGECLAFLADALRALADKEPHASVALLGRDADTAELYWDGLSKAGVERLKRVRRQDFSFGPGVEVTDVSQAKGLEFDYVVLLDVSATSWPATDAARRILHVGATRAAHQLWVTTVGRPSPLIPTGER
jgi:DNA helicase II / ATP-dependent DNA helicase PcrA